MSTFEDEAGAWNYRSIPWRELNQRFIRVEMRWTQESFAETFGLDTGDLSNMINGRGRLGTPAQPKNLLKLVKGYIIGEFPDHPPAIRSEAQLRAFLAAVPDGFWFERWRVFRSLGVPWVEQEVVEAFTTQRNIWTENPVVVRVMHMAMPRCKNKACNQLQKELLELLIHLSEQPEQSTELIEEFVQRWSQGSTH